MFKRIVLVAALLMLSGLASAATISKGQIPGVAGPYGIKIEGDIKAGDAEAFKKLLLSYDENNLPQEVFLFSPGGDFLEALKIGRIIRKLKLTTHAPVRQTVQLVEYADPVNRVCASSCFFIFVAGVRRYGDIVGIHRPYLPNASYRRMNMDQAAHSHTEVRELVASYLREMDVPSRFVEQVMAVDSGNIKWLEEKDLEEEFQGFASTYREWIEAQCPGLSIKEQATYEEAGRQRDAASLRIIEQLGLKLEESVNCRATLQRLETWQAWQTLLGSV